MAFSFIQKWADIQYLSSRKFVRWNLELHQGSEAPCKVIIILWIKLNDYSSTTNLCPFIQGSLEWPFSELFSANVSVWNQYKYIAFNIFSCRILIVLYKMLIITEISNEKTNELTIYGILCWNVTIFYRQELVSLFQVQEKLKACRSSKLNFSSSCFIADNSYVKIVWLHTVAFSEHDILNFWDNVHLFKYRAVKISQNWFNSFNYSNQTHMQVSKI